MTSKKPFNPIFKGDSEPRKGDVSSDLPPAPPWRRFSADPTERAQRDEHRGRTYKSRPEEIDIVNAALYLRRPLLISGPPGIGKSSLAYAVAFELNLGPVLRWSITSRSTLRDGLYSYDAVARLQAANLAEKEQARPLPIGEFIRLGPLGTAFYDSGNLNRPRMRVLLVDEIDKSDLDLPNDLLHVLEEGEFVIDELRRDARMRRQQNDKQLHQGFDVRRWDDSYDQNEAHIASDGRVRCSSMHFPLVIFTSNGEREFPPAFLRRCLRLKLDSPNEEELRKIIDAHFDQEIKDELRASYTERRDELIKRFLAKIGGKDRDQLATDQLLNAIYVRTREHRTLAAGDGESLEDVINMLLAPLNR